MPGCGFTARKLWLLSEDLSGRKNASAIELGFHSSLAGGESKLSFYILQRYAIHLLARLLVTDEAHVCFVLSTDNGPLCVRPRWVIVHFI
jgi:hypothetical protein